jgi:type IV secretory pathway TrbF-like protein
MQQVEQKNTYLESRTLWNDVYGSLQTKLENSYRIIFCLSVVIAIAMVGFVIIASNPKIKPMPFVLHGNDIITLSDQNAAAFSTLRPKLSLILAQDFIRHARITSGDNTVNANNHIAALSVVNGAAAHVLKNYFHTCGVDQSSQTTTNNVQINSVLAQSDHTLEIRWTEESRNAQSGDVISTMQYIADMTYTFDAPSSNPIILKNNPLGFVITNLSWSKDQSNAGEQ